MAGKLKKLIIDSYPTKVVAGYGIRPGHALPYGATIVPGGVNFSVFSKEATACSLALFHRHEREPFAVIPFTEDTTIGNVYCMIVYDLDYENIEYGYYFDGPWDPDRGRRFDGRQLLLDPYGRIVTGRDIWAGTKISEAPWPLHSAIAMDDFDWQGEQPLERDMRDLIIYEAHVRGFTKDPSAGVKYPGSFAGLKEKLPYLKDLGINALELMPIFEFDELEHRRVGPMGEELFNYWGYSTVGFFAPKAGYAASGKYRMQMDELKTLIREAHKQDIEIILDVVFNHTGEGGEGGPTFSFRGIDNEVYYMLTPDGKYYNFSGTGNTLNANHPVVRNLILDCLRYWVDEYHIDGFRFDLASILGRDQDGAPMSNPPLLEALAHDPLLGKTRLIAEAWDAGGLYQVGSFPSWGRFAEWNGRFRDDVRRFLKGDENLTWLASQYLAGSPHIYDQAVRGICPSVNFITCHDGFTLWDLYSYNEKQNVANGEDNRDGSDANYSWDCLLTKDDGSVDEAATTTLRRRMVKNALAFLLLARGAPMILAGDEFGNSQQGNNNAYCQDNAISWLNWEDKETNADIYEFTKKLIALRQDNDCLKSQNSGDDHNAAGYPGLSFHGGQAWQFDTGGHLLGALFCDDDAYIYAAFNVHWEDHEVELPVLPEGFRWQLYATSWAQPEEIVVRDNRLPVKNRSVVVLLAKKGESS